MKQYRAVLLFCFFCAAAFCGVSQTKIIDSLKNKMWAEAVPGKKLQLLIDLCGYHQSINKDSLYQYALSANTLAFKNENKTNKSLAAIILINAYLRMGNIDSASVLVDAGLRDNAVKDPATRSTYFKLAALKADCFGDASNYTDALTELYKIINEAEQYKDSVVVAKNMSTIGVINYNLDHVSEAFSWYFKALSFITDAPRFYSSASLIYINLAETYRWVQQADSAAFYINKAITLCSQNENLYYLANALRVKANIYKEKKRIPTGRKNNAGMYCHKGEIRRESCHG